MDLHIDIDLAAIPFDVEQDPESGQITAYNDEMRVMAIGKSTQEAHHRFQGAVVELAQAEIEAGRPLPAILQSRIFA